MTAAPLVLYDSIDVAALPANGTCFGAYVNGMWPTYPAVRARFPHAQILSIAVTADADADALDVETGDATPGQAPAWVRRQQARAVHRPVLYCSASGITAVLAALQAAGISRAEVRLWSAHYGEGQHICGPGTCRYTIPDGRIVPACDGTQWTDLALGRSLDESVLDAGFFDVPVPPAPAPPAPPKGAGMPGIWKSLISVTPVFTGAAVTGWVVTGIGEDGAVWTTTKTGKTWSAAVRLDTVTIKP